MSYQEIWDSRDKLNKKLVDRLHMYGNIEPPGIYGRPYNAGAKHGHEYPLSRANYLRLLVMQDGEHKYEDPRWIWQDTARKNGWKLRQGARPAYIEVYRKDDKGDYHAGLMKFYNVQDYKNYPYGHITVKGDRPEDFRTAIGILRDNGVDITWKADTKQIFDCVKKYASSHGEDEFASAMTAQIFLKTNYLSYNYANHHLFTDEQLDRLKENPKILFAAVKKAQNLYDRMEGIREKVQRQEQGIKEALQKTKQQELWKPKYDGLFQDLYVSMDWSESPIKGPNGEPYRDNLHLKGEAAYEFLARLNAQDKDVFNDKLRGSSGYNKVKLSISYGDYHMTQPEILEMGQLAFKNEKVLAEGLLRHFNEQRTALLESEELRRNLLERNTGLSDEQIIENCQKANAFCKDELRKMRQEESLYLQFHPEIESINAKQADTFLYVIRNDDIDKIPSRFILNKQKGEDMPELMVAEVGEPYNFRSYGPGKGESIIASQLSVNSPLIKSLPLKPAYDEENQIDIINLESKLVLTEKNQGSLLKPNVEISKEYHGLSALQRYGELKHLDREGARTIQQANRLSRGDMNRMDVILSYNGKELSHVSYEEGTGKLYNEGISLHGLVKENEELKRAVYVGTKVYGGVDDNAIRAIQSEEKVSIPTAQEMLDEVLKKKPSSRTVNFDLYEYYQDAASQDLSNNTIEKVQASMIELMKEHGLRDIKINNICKTHESFNPKLLEKAGNGILEANPDGSKENTSISPKEALLQEITLEKESQIVRN